MTHEAPPNWAEWTTDVLCPLCRYNLRGLETPRCPECGYTFAWPEVLDPNRRLHPYLFEHHPERNVRSFCQTAVGVFRPLRFWTSLHPIQPSNRRRLILYLVVGQGLYLLAMAGITLSVAYSKARWNNAVAAQHAAQFPARIAAIPAEERQELIRPYGSPQAWLAATTPPPQTTASHLQRQFSRRQFPLSFTCSVIAPLAWPWLTFLALSLFSTSIRRSRLNRTHVLRCVTYSFDAALWAALYGIALAAASILYTGSPLRIQPFIYVGIPVILVIGGLYGVFRLSVACKLYLQIKHPLATVLLLQVAVGLLLANGLILQSIWGR
jgi:hypothetical protein